MKKSQNNMDKKKKLPDIVRDKILLDIYSSKLQPGQLYATENDLVKRLNVSRNTIRQAMNELEMAGFIVRRQRVGIIVTEKACTAVHPEVNIVENVINQNKSLQKQKIILVLPVWDYGTGNFFNNLVLRELSSGNDDLQKFIVEVRLFDDPLDDISEDIRAILTVDPMQQLIPALDRLAKRGIEIIAIETKVPLYMAVNIRFDIYQQAKEAVKLLFNKGHRKIGIVNHDTGHDTFRQWLSGYIDAHKELNLAIYPNGFIQIHDGIEEKLKNVKDITAWICTFNSGVNLLTQACHENGLKIPEDISIIGGDDPGDIVVSSIGCKLTVCRPDYIILSQMIRQILCHKMVVMAGDVISCPMTWIMRDSVNAYR